MEQPYIPNPSMGISWADVCGAQRRADMTLTVADFDGGPLLTERQSRKMLSNHKLLGSPAGPEELAEGPEGLSTLAPCSQWLPHSLWLSGVL